MASVETLEQLGDWLEDQPREMPVAFATRAALRVCEESCSLSVFRKVVFVPIVH
jgi:hypothetical protein